MKVLMEPEEQRRHGDSCVKGGAEPATCGGSSLVSPKDGCAM
jgi:hypothetical protein